MVDLSPTVGEENGIEFLEYKDPRMMIHGRIWNGVPAGGDFVKPEDVGDNYVSAGYR
jgi:hypothetical protein